jgi:tyrosyl-tRNA synthetase
VLRALSEQQLLEVMDGVPQVTGSLSALEAGVDLISFLADHGVFASKGEAKKMIQSGGFSINKEKITSLDHKLTTENLLNAKYLLLQKGKKDYTLASFI